MSDFTDALIWLVPPLALVLYIRLRKSPIAVRGAGKKKRASAQALADEGSPLAALMAGLDARGLTPATGETLAHFLTRALPAMSAGVKRADLIKLYYRWRFAPRGDGATDERLLREKTETFATRLTDVST